MGAGILDCNGVAVVVVHVGEEIDRVSVVVDGFAGNDSESVELVAECSFANNELRGIGAVETVDAIGPAHAILQLSWEAKAGGFRAGFGRFGRRRNGGAIVEETRGIDDVFGNVFERQNYVLIARFGRPRHVPGYVMDFIVLGEKLI